MNYRVLLVCGWAIAIASIAAALVRFGVAAAAYVVVGIAASAVVSGLKRKRIYEFVSEVLFSIVYEYELKVRSLKEGDERNE